MTTTYELTRSDAPCDACGCECHSPAAFDVGGLATLCQEHIDEYADEGSLCDRCLRRGLRHARLTVSDLLAIHPELREPDAVGLGSSS